VVQVALDFLVYNIFAHCACRQDRRPYAMTSSMTYVDHLGFPTEVLKAEHDTLTELLGIHPAGSDFINVIYNNNAPDKWSEAVMTGFIGRYRRYGSIPRWAHEHHDKNIISETDGVWWIGPAYTKTDKIWLTSESEGFALDPPVWGWSIYSANVGTWLMEDTAVMPFSMVLAWRTASVQREIRELKDAITEKNDTAVETVEIDDEWDEPAGSGGTSSTALSPSTVEPRERGIRIRGGFKKNCAKIVGLFREGKLDELKKACVVHDRWGTQPRKPYAHYR